MLQLNSQMGQNESARWGTDASRETSIQNLHTEGTTTAEHCQEAITLPGGKIAGFLKTDGVFVRRVDPRKHLLRLPEPSIAIDKGVLAQLAERSCTKISLLMGGTDKREIGLNDFLRLGKDIEYGSYGKQTACALRFFRKVGIGR